MLKNIMANKYYLAIAFLVACVCLYILYTKWWRKPNLDLEESTTSIPADENEDEDEEAALDTIDEDDNTGEYETDGDGKVTDITGLDTTTSNSLSTVNAI